MAIILPATAKDDLLSGAFVCRHNAGSWNAVSADQFGEQTAIKIGKGGLKGITLSPEQVAECIDSFPISAYVSDSLDHCYSPDQANSSSETPHKEEGIKRRKVDTDDHRRISEELDKCSHPLEIESDVLYNIVNGQVAPVVVNGADALPVGVLMVTAFRKPLPARFHAKLSSPVKTMEKLSLELRSVTRWSSTWSPYFFVFCWSVSNVRWNSCQSSDTKWLPLLHRFWTSMAVSGIETRQYTCIGLA